MENKDNQKQKTQDEIWDEQMEDPDNAVFFESLDEDIAKALANGDFVEDGEVPDNEK
jgi:hypothetical protein